MLFDCDKIKLDHLSWTQVSMFLRNPAAWYYHYVKYAKQKKYINKSALELGTMYHEALEKLYKGQDLNSVLLEFDNALSKYDDNPALKEQVNNLKETITYYAMHILPHYQPNVQPNNVELSIDDFYIDGVDVPIYLKIDVLTDNGIIIDHKTMGYKSVNASTHGQLFLYGLWYYRKYGVLPLSVELHKTYKPSYKRRFNSLVTIDRVSVRLPELLNVENVVRFVYKNIKECNFYWSFEDRNSPYREEYFNEVIKG